MNTVAFFGRMCGWNKAEVEQLTAAEINYLVTLFTRDVQGGDAGDPLLQDIPNPPDDES